MYKLIFRAGVIFILSFSFAMASEELSFNPPEIWVEDNKIPAPDSKKAAAPFQFLLIDTQTNFIKGSTDSYMRSAIKVQNPAGLATASNINIPWDPETGKVIVHHIRILRGNEIIDVLDSGQRFTVLRREPNLEAAIIDGVLTATIQPSGLQVGDIVDIAYTHKFYNPIFGDTVSHIAPFLTANTLGELRIRYIWPEGRQMRWQATRDLPKPKIKRKKNGHELRLVMKDVTPPTNIPESAPFREYLSGVLEISDISDWSKISSLMAPLYSTSTQLDPNSPLQVEAAKIAALTNDPTERTEKALRLVQDKIRYLFLAIDSGAYIPASADETWARRFGDCKAKTVVLLALLHALGIEAEPALVSNNFGDGLNKRLPIIGVFDHMIVKAKIGNKIHWLDGTRLGDRGLSYIPTPPYHWALPLRNEGAALEPLEIAPLEEPQTSIFLDIDASQGAANSIPISGRMIINGDAAILLRRQVNIMTPEQVKDTQTAIWRTVNTAIDANKMDIAYNENAPVITLTITGNIELKEKTQDNFKYYVIPNNRTGWNASSMTDGDTIRKAPWLLPHPSYLKKVTTIALPDDRFPIILMGTDINLEIGGVELKRSVTVDNNVLTMQSSFRTTLPELAAAHTAAFARDMTSAYKNIAKFNARTLSQFSTLSGNHKDPKPPVNAQYFLERGKAFANTQRFQEAIADFNKVIALDNTISEAYSGRGLAYFFQQELEKSSADFEHANELDEDNMTAVLGQGMIFASDGNHEAAIEKFDRAYEPNSNLLNALLYRAEAKNETGDLAGAIEDSRTLIQRLPEFLEVKLHLVHWLQDYGDTEEAISTITQLIRQVPDESEYYQLRADLHEETGNISLALTDLDKVVDLSNGSPDTLNSRCWFRAMHNIKIDMALKDCNKSLRIRENDANTLDSRGYVYLRMGEFENAITDFTAALTTNSKSPSSLYGRGLARLRSGDALGNDDIDHAVEISPDSVSSLEDHGLRQ